MKKQTLMILATGMVLGVMFLSVGIAVPPATKYNPGEAVDPGCGPTDSNCSVDIGSGSADTDWTEDSNGVWNNTDDIGIGTPTPGAKLDVVGDITNTITTTSGTQHLVSGVDNLLVSLPIYDTLFGGIPNALSGDISITGSTKTVGTQTGLIGNIDNSSWAATGGTDSAGPGMMWYDTATQDLSFFTMGQDGLRVNMFKDPTTAPQIAEYVFGASGLQVGDYTFPLTDGSSNQVLQTDGSGSVSWATVSGGGSDTTTASNGLTEASEDIKLGGDLTEDTTIDTNSNSITIEGDDITGVPSRFVFNGAFPDHTGSLNTGMFFVPTSGTAGAFRLGSVGDDSWDLSNLADNSIAIGFGTPKATGIGAIAIGGANLIASGPGALALGDYSAIASGDHSFAWGNHTAGGDGASGGQSIALGDHAGASGDTSISMGYFTRSYGNYSLSIGHNAEAKSLSEIALGRHNTDYTPINTSGLVGSDSSNTFYSADRLFVLGNGNDGGLNSDALTVLKSAETGIDIDNFEANTDGNKLQVNGSITATIPVYATTAAAAADGGLTTGQFFKVTNGDGTSALHIKD